MIALEVSRNGKRVCVAGVDDNGVVDAIINCVGSPGLPAPPHLFVGGLVNETGQHVRWVWQDIAVGDEITVRVVEVGVEEVDQPQDAIDLLPPVRPVKKKTKEKK